MKYIDDFLNSITMYRLVLYFLIILAVVGLVLSFVGILPFKVFDYVFSFIFILAVSYVANNIFASVFEVPVNVESYLITGLILGLIITPPRTFQDVIFLGWVSLLAVAGKFIFTINKKHIFNPAALAVALTAIFINGNATWWVGTASMLPIVAIGGFLVVRKIRRWDLVLSFLGIAFITIVFTGMFRNVGIFTSIRKSLLESPLIFFATIMLTEPLTTPPTQDLRIWYGGLIGFLFAPQIHIAGIYSTPELALIVGNVFSYLVSPKYKLILRLKEKLKLSDDVYDFVFTSDSRINFTPGQYMEFTFEHPSPDSRGNRRYLSLASSPTEDNIRLGIKFGHPSSSFKRNLLEISSDQKILAGQLIGDFTLPKDPNRKLVFVAGGIGITPYRSMIKYLLDKQEKRDIAVFYTASKESDFVYKDVLSEASDKLGIRTIYFPTDSMGHANPESISKNIPDFGERTFYLSGSHGVVVAFEKLLSDLGVPANRIVKDYFPGFV